MSKSNHRTLTAAAQRMQCAIYTRNPPKTASSRNSTRWTPNGTAAATRRVGLYTFDRSTQQFSWVGAITLTFPAATNHTLRALRVTYDKHTAGTVAVSGTTVTGTGTSWQTDGACVGNRIGFGSGDPTQITNWYEITAIGSNTSITVDVSPGTLSAGTPYVIEDLRVVNVTTNATAANGGLFVAKGLRPESSFLRAPPFPPPPRSTISGPCTG